MRPGHTGLAREAVGPAGGRSRHTAAAWMVLRLVAQACVSPSRFDPTPPVARHPLIRTVREGIAWLQYGGCQNNVSRTRDNSLAPRDPSIGVLPASIAQPDPALVVARASVPPSQQRFSRLDIVRRLCRCQ